MKQNKLFFLYLSDVGAKWLIQKSTLFYKVIPSAMKKWFYMRGGLSSRGQFMSTGTMYLICQSACQIWPEKMCGLWWEGPYKGRVMTFNITFNNISVSFTGAGNRSTRKKKHQPAAHNWQLDHIMLYWVHLAWAWFKLTMLMVIGTDCIGSWKPNNHRIMTMMAQRWEVVAHFVDICVTVDHHFLFIKWWK